MALPPQSVSPNFSFTFNGTSLTVSTDLPLRPGLPKEDWMSRTFFVDLTPGASFAWRDGPNTYRLTLQGRAYDRERMAQIEASRPPTPGPSPVSGFFQLEVRGRRFSKAEVREVHIRA